ncbi:Similar to Transcriptional regulatory protein moc3; acc. no. Q9UT46 [Pyronema omphalodes CBS 100304]|uniref:Similar to Transcriptional regulatory protein moc3 acc. no. Q9UT46 n=1 Tax=Pyronema omphalodes (strain CBS 100304) TaxID=1076935 RepID=U4LB50_PYROM|nr:Similar to Transcriptional regulatory protein moc3; acc. no. Q9UT46 [Pyronema omphalodes CBS 100304]
MVANSRPKRVRTGCLTCRERHLKCDEGTPDCQNCRKSNRTCKRGVRLNFIDIQTEQPPFVVPISHEWKIDFQDESREIASEYAGGVKRYAPFINTATPVRTKNSPPTPRSNPSMSSQMSAFNPTSNPTTAPVQHRRQSGDSAYSRRDVKPESHSQSPPPYNAHASLQHPPPPPPSRPISHPPDPSPSSDRMGKPYLDDPDETFFMQLFVEEVGIWMDSLDTKKHFARILPFTALDEPMLYNALLACGVRHFCLVNPSPQNEDRALNYYDRATRLIRVSLEEQSKRDQQLGPTKETEMCAATAIVLNVYDIMSERPLARMNHIAGARLLLAQCQWNASTRGLGGACFWLNITMELLSCLRFSWAVSWSPDDWGLDVEFSRPTSSGEEEIWAHRMVYILAKIANFKAMRKDATSNHKYISPEELQKHHQQWEHLNNLCASWEAHLPRTMRPMAYLPPHPQKSAFPETWLIKRCAIVAHLFYHTGLLIMSQINPYHNEEMVRQEMYHAHRVCGIAAHVKDRGVSSVALRSLATASESLTDRTEQEEVLTIFERIKKDTGWQINFVLKDLRQKWGWEAPERLPQPASLLQISPITQGQPQQQQQQQAGYKQYTIPQGQQQQQQQQQVGQQHRQSVSQQQHRQSQSHQSQQHHGHNQPPPPQQHPQPQRRLVNPLDIGVGVQVQTFYPPLNQQGWGLPGTPSPIPMNGQQQQQQGGGLERHYMG